MLASHAVRRCCISMGVNTQFSRSVQRWHRSTPRAFSYAVPVSSTRPELLEPVHDLVGDVKMPGQAKGEMGVKGIALRHIKEGEMVFREVGPISSQPGMHTIQIGRNEHMAIRGETRFLSHSFNPNCKVTIYYGSSHPLDVSAVRDIPEGETLTFDYTTTEWDMAEPFDDCDIGLRCAGFRNLPSDEKHKRLKSGSLPSHILEMWLLDIEKANAVDIH